MLFIHSDFYAPEKSFTLLFRAGIQGEDKTHPFLLGF